MTDAERRSAWAGLMRALPAPVAATKPQLRSCVDAADDWVGGNLAGFQAAIPEALRADGPGLHLLGNAAAIAGGAEVPDVSAGITADRTQSALLLGAYNAANAWLTANAGGYLTALGADGQALSTGQAFRVLEAVCRGRVA